MLNNVLSYPILYSVLVGLLLFKYMQIPNWLYSSDILIYSSCLQCLPNDQVHLEHVPHHVEWQQTHYPIIMLLLYKLIMVSWMINCHTILPKVRDRLSFRHRYSTILCQINCEFALAFYGIWLKPNAWLSLYYPNQTINHSHLVHICTYCSWESDTTVCCHALFQDSFIAYYKYMANTWAMTSWYDGGGGYWKYNLGFTFGQMLLLLFQL